MYTGDRGMTWEILLNAGVRELPVNLNVICKHLGVPAMSYIRGQRLIAELGKRRQMKESDGFIVRSESGKALIFYNSACSVGRQRFTIAHKLGHLLLNHHGDLINREPSPGDNLIEREANVFASRLLAPACVLWGVNTCNPSSISELCNISYRAAEFRARRMASLMRTDRRFMAERGRSYFLQSPLEERLYHQFLPYIMTHQAPLFGGALFRDD